MIGILDYGMGNLSSVTNALNYLGVENTIVEKKDDFTQLSKLIIPGVGAFEKAMDNIIKKDFLNEILEFDAKNKQILGICLGMQLLAELGTEPCECTGIGLIKGTVIHLPQNLVRVPHVGWNGINIINNHPILESVKISADFYFVHSYYFDVVNKKNIITTTEYDIMFPSIVSNDKGNVVGIQFHPEKSQKQGLKILENFANWIYA